MSARATLAGHLAHAGKDGGFASSLHVLQSMSSEVSPGEVEIEFCCTCSWVVRVSCGHIRCTWKHLDECPLPPNMIDDPDEPECGGCLLECDLCGADCT